MSRGFGTIFKNKSTISGTLQEEVAIMANEAMSEERLRKIQDDIEYARHVQESGNLSHIGEKLLSVASELLSALRETQEQYRELSLSYITAVGQAQHNAEHAEKAEEAGYRRGVESAIEVAKQQRCRDEYPKTNREKISHERGCNGAIKRIRALLPPDTQTEDKTP